MRMRKEITLFFFFLLPLYSHDVRLVFRFIIIINYFVLDPFRRCRTTSTRVRINKPMYSVAFYKIFLLNRTFLTIQ